VYAMALGVFFAYKVESKVGDLYRSKLDEINAPLASLKDQDAKLSAAIGNRDNQAKQIDQMKDVAVDRFYWMNVLSDLRSALIQAEATTKSNLTTVDNKGTNTDVGVWVQQFQPLPPGGDAFGGTGAVAAPVGGGFPGMRRRGMGSMPMAAPTPVAAAPAAPAGAIASINIVFEGMHRDPSADADLAYMVLQCVTNTPSFVSATLSPQITQSPEDTNTMTFSMVAQLKRPLKL
jgi:hypothetical protein